MSTEDDINSSRMQQPQAVMGTSELKFNSQQPLPANVTTISQTNLQDDKDAIVTNTSKTQLQNEMARQSQAFQSNVLSQANSLMMLGSVGNGESGLIEQER